MLPDRVREAAVAPMCRLTHRLGRMEGWQAAIVIPVKDEEDRPPACLGAAVRAIRAAG